MSKQATINVPVKFTLTESDDGAARQREMAGHARRTGRAWIELADSLDSLADFIDTLPKEEA